MDNLLVNREKGCAPCSKLAARGAVSHDVSADAGVPDYMPPIGRIVSFSAAALDENRFLDGSSVEVSGLLACTVTYAGDDSTLCTYPVNCDYSVRIPLGQGADEVGASDVAARTEVVSFTPRAAGPRKLVLTAKLSTSVFALSETDLSPVITASSGEQGGDRSPTAAEEASVEFRKKTERSSSARFIHGAGETSGEFTVPGGTGEDGGSPKILNCVGVCSVTGVSPTADGVAVRGETHVSCLALTADGEYVSVGAKAPFEERLVAPRSVSDGGETDCAAFVRCASVTVNDAGGGVFVFTAEHDIDAELWVTEESEIADDAYSTEYGCDAVREEAEPVFFSGGVSGSFSASGSGRLPAGGERSVIASSGRVTGGSAEASPDGRFVFTGTCVVSSVVVGDGSAEPVEVSIPVRFETRLKNGVPEGGEPIVRWEAAVTSSSAKPDGERLNAVAEISICASVAVKKKIPAILSVRLKTDEPIPRVRSSVRIRFPESGQTAWDVRRDLCAGRDQVTVLFGDGDGVLPPGSAVIVNER